RRVEAPRRPRTPLRRRLRRPQPDPHALADREAARLPRRDRARDVDEGTGAGADREQAARRLRGRGPLPQADPAAGARRVRERHRGRGHPLRRPRRQEGHAPPRRPRAAAENQLQNRQDRKENEVTTTTENKGMAERGMGYGLRALNRLAGSDLLDRIRIRKQVEKALFQGTKNGFKGATAAGRAFKATQQLGKPARQKKGNSTGLFDLTPDDEQQMFQEAGRAFASDLIGKAAL